MKTAVSVAPAYYPISLATAKDHLRVTHDDDNEYISSLIGAATNKVESLLGRRLITQTWLYYLDAWPDGNEIILPFGQLQSVSYVYYTVYDSTSGTATTQYTTFTEGTSTTDEFSVDTVSDPGRIILRYGETWPTESPLIPYNPIEIKFVCGYGAHTPLTITGATNATPIVCTTAAHGYSVGDQVYIEGGTTMTSVNGLWRIASVPLTTTFSLTGSIGNGVYDASSATVIRVDIPEPIRQAIKIMVSDMYENRESEVMGLSTTHLKTIEALLLPYRIFP